MISRLASQHHTSEYSLAKFGPNGCPIKYLPISLHLPHLFKELQLRQLQAAHIQPWWYSHKQAEHQPVFVLGPGGSQPHQASLLHEQIEAAILSSLPLLPPSVKTSASHPINISPIIPFHLLSLISSHLYPSHPPISFALPPLLSLDLLIHDTSITSSSCPLSIPSLGNLFLSSCPGKKVRLQGSVKGRSGVCRDLHTDLQRIRALGVRCIVCCLDDAELEFLGVPWHEYEEYAALNQLDVLRLPTPEGLAPLTPASLDTHLTDLIDTFTLRGVHVLIHCRGGVGRAGVVACCWLIKLGLCGWVEPHREPIPLTTPSARPDFDRTDTLRFVEKIIAVVRKRRSMKAVETYEQVCFLVDFVEYLRSSGGSDVTLSIT